MFEAIIICVFAIGFLTAQVKLQNGYEQEGLIEHTTLCGTIYKTEENGENSISLILKDVVISGESDSQNIKGAVELIIYGQDAEYLESEFFLKGSVIRADATLSYPTEACEYGFSDERLQMLTDNAYYKCLAHYAQAEVIYEKQTKVLTAINGMRNAVFGRIKRYIGDDEGELIKALVTGNKSSLSSQIKSDFSSLGISHILATSGLHIGILLLSIKLLLKKLRAPIIIEAAISSIVLLTFIIFAGFRASMMRAAWMWVPVIVSDILGRKITPINALGGAALLMCVWNPFVIFDISFILSCVCVAAIVMFLDSKSVITRFINKNKLLGITAASFAVMAVAWPLTAYYFNSISVLSSIFNILFVPLAGVMLFIGLAFCIFSGVGFIAGVLGTAAKALSFVTINAAEFLSRLSIEINVVSPPSTIIILWILGMVVLSGAVFIIPKKIKIIISSAMLLTAAAIMTVTQNTSVNNSQMKVYSDGTSLIIYAVDEKDNALILNTDSYLASSILSKSAASNLDKLVYTGNDEDELSEILTDLVYYDIAEIYAASSVAQSFNETSDIFVKELNETDIMGFNVTLLEFKGKADTAKIHYAAHITGYGEEFLYLDPLVLREGAFDGAEFDTIISSRWSSSRAEYIKAVEFDNLLFSTDDNILKQMAASLEELGVNTYNISGKVKILIDIKDN